MNVLVTGAAGFVGRNLTEALKNVRDGKDRTRGGIEIGEIFSYDLNSSPEELRGCCERADFVFNLAGVNRPKDEKEYMPGNFGFASVLLDTLKAVGNACPVMLASSVQASLVGRYDGEYGRSKKAGEELFFRYACETGAKTLVYRFPNLFGKWARPNYNSAVATFCHNFANDLPVTVNDPSTELELLYIDDLIDEMFAALSGSEHRCEFDGTRAVFRPDGRFCAVPVTHKVTLGEIVGLLEDFARQPETLIMPDIPAGSFENKLYATYLSYLPERKISFPLKMKRDERGSFTELLKAGGCGQFSVNISKPGAVKGMHWHNTKWEFFIVVSGRALIEERRIGTDGNGEPFPTVRFEVSGEEMRAVHMLPGYTHSIINLSDKDDLGTLMWASERFDPSRPDTFAEPV